MNLKNSTLIIVPAYNEASVIARTLQDLRETLKSEKINADVIVIDDGSSDGTGGVAHPYIDYLLTHRRNCGLGASITTGIEYAKREGYDYCITFDADGQHDPKDIKKTLSQLMGGYDLVIGSRFLGTYANMPRGRKLLLQASNLITFLFFGIWTTDSQSGFRGLSKQAIDSIHLKSNRMEVSSEIFGEIKRFNLRFKEIPIHIRYTQYSLGKGQTNSQGTGVLIKLLYSLWR